MVTIIGNKILQNAEGKPFIALLLEGDLEFVKSKTTGNLYATALRCVISSTFNENRANELIGKKIPGRIMKVECEPYQYIVPSTGEEITLSHTYRYDSQSTSVEEEVFV